MKYNWKKAFSLVEIIIALGILVIILPSFISILVLWNNRLTLDRIRTESSANISIVNNILHRIIKNSYGISYSHYEDNAQFDKITLYDDKLEKNTIELYVKQELDKDISRVYLYKDNREIPLHSTKLFITELSIEIPNRDLVTQPFVSLYIKGRSRSPLEIPTDDRFYDLYNKSESSLRGRWIIKNYVPSTKNI